VQQYDYSRVYKGKIDLLSGLPSSGERARPIQTLAWYPAQKSAAPALLYGDYIRSATTEEVFARTDAEVKQLAGAWIGQRWGGIGAAQAEQEWRRPMWAVRDAVELPGKFPVVIYAPSFSASAHESADLCEYLASQGYLVLASPDMGAHERTMSHDIEGVEAQVGDIEFLIGYAHGLAQADMAHLAVVGYSWGGMSNVFAAAKDSRITALVSLDGSLRYFPELVNSAKYVVPARLALPFLFVAARPRSIEDLLAKKQDLSASLMNNMAYTDLYKVTMYPMTHANFSSEYQRFASDAGGFGEYSRAETSLAHSWMARYVHQFLNAYLKNDAAGLAFMNGTPEKNLVPPHMLTLESRHANGQPPTLETLAEGLGKRGFEHAGEVYKDIKSRHGDFQPSEESLRGWGYQLLLANKTGAAIEIFKLVTVLFPDSWNAFDCLAEAYQQNQDRALAIKHYRRSLELEPKNDNAAQHLKTLNAAR